MNLYIYRYRYLDRYISIYFYLSRYTKITPFPNFLPANYLFVIAVSELWLGHRITRPTFPRTAPPPSKPGNQCSRQKLSGTKMFLPRTSMLNRRLVRHNPYGKVLKRHLYFGCFVLPFILLPLLIYYASSYFAFASEARKPALVRARARRACTIP